MKWLLVSLILCPVILFGQTGRQDVVDSIKAAATSLQSVSSFINNNPGIKTGSVNISDTGDFVTISLRVRIATGVIAAIPLKPADELKTASIAGELDGVDILPIPLPAEEPGMIAAISVAPVSKLGTYELQSIKADTVTKMAIPDPEAAEELPFLTITTLVIKERIVRTADTVNVPDIPDLTVMEVLPVLSIAPFKIAERVVQAKNALIIPDIPEPETTEDVPVVVATAFKTEPKAVRGPDMVTTATVPEVQLTDDVPFFEPVKMDIKLAHVGRLDTVIILSFEEKRMPVEGMHLSDEGYTLLEKLEGFSPELYALGDGGFTIGFGFFVPFGEGSMWNKGVTWDEAVRLIRQKVPTYEDQVKKYINVTLTQNEFDALTMLAYNLGGFSKATSIVNDVNTDADYYKLQSDWKRFVHSKAPGMTRGLLNRRRDELEVRNEKNYQPERKIQILKRAK